MSLSVKAERALMSHEEFELLSQTHYPALIVLEDEAIAGAKRRIRDLRDKDRTFARSMQRRIRGKAEPRGASFPGNVEKPARRKQVFTSALKRLNAEATRREAIAAQQALIESAQRALALKTSAGERRHPFQGRSSRSGMRPVASNRQDNLVNRANVGRAVRATKVAQAKRDQRSGG
jgi:hypothetical protein